MNQKGVLIVSVLLSMSQVDTSTHWIVTEDGKLHAQTDSLFNMRRPYDLAAFMEQEVRFKKVEQLKAELASQQHIVDSEDDKDDGFEEKFIASEPSCIKAGKRLQDFDLYISTVLPLENKGIRAEDHIGTDVLLPTVLSEPHCSSYPLEFSIHAFEHLEGVQNRQFLEGIAEHGLKSAVTDKENTEEFGHLIYEAMRKNQSSWVLYNMAAFYWRIKGNANEAIECLRRALHYSPSQHRDVAYVSLGNILHRSKYSHEAAIVLETSLSQSSNLNVNHFTLGNIYAVLTMFNKSIECFDKTLANQPHFDAAEKRKWAVICHFKLEMALEQQHKQLQEALDHLKSYQKKHETLQTLSSKLVTEQASHTDRIKSNVELNNLLQNRKDGVSPLMGEHCEQVDGQKDVRCEWKKTEVKKNDTLELTEDKRFSILPLNLEELNKMLLKEETIEESVEKEENTSAPVEIAIVDVSKKQNEDLAIKSKPVYRSNDWPSNEECSEHKTKSYEWNEYPTTFLPPESKKFDSQMLLSEAIDLPPHQQHPLPWYPPVCVNIVDLKQGEMFLDNVEAIKDRDQAPTRLSDPSMKKILLNLVKNGEVEEEEVGQRILTSLKQNLAPRWLFYNLAGLYWRVVGNNYQGIECLRRSLHFVPADYVDVPLVNMANILYKWNKLDDALNMTRQALLFSPKEPITHFTQANLLAAKKNESGAIYHYEMALQYDPDFTLALDMLRNLKCTMKYYQKVITPVEKNVCPSSKNNQQKKMDSCTKQITVCGDNKVYIEDKMFIDSHIEEQDGMFSLGTFLRKNKKIDPMEAEAMKEFHKLNGLCTGEDCEHVVHKPGTEPYIKLRAVDSSSITQKLLFASPEVKLDEPGVCILRKNGYRSEECSSLQYEPHNKRMESLDKVLLELMEFIYEQEKAGELLIDDEAAFQERSEAQKSGQFIDLNGFVEVNGVVDIVCVTEDKDHIRCVSKNEAATSQMQIPSSSKPVHKPPTKKPLKSFIPTRADCQNLKEVDIKAFTSTWISITTGDIEFAEDRVALADFLTLLDLTEHIDDVEDKTPVCDGKFPASISMFDHLSSIANKEKLKYSSEPTLKKIIKAMTISKESLSSIGYRIHRNLVKSPNSWVYGCLGALYWRALGNATNAINCLKMALLNVPADRKHIPLVSLANILHKAEQFDDALEIAHAALEGSSDSAAIHFSIGNIYAAKGDIKQAQLYYESTLSLQPDLKPARERLVAITCGSLADDND